MVDYLALGGLDSLIAASMRVSSTALSSSELLSIPPYMGTWSIELLRFNENWVAQEVRVIATTAMRMRLIFSSSHYGQAMTGFIGGAASSDEALRSRVMKSQLV